MVLHGGDGVIDRLSGRAHAVLSSSDLGGPVKHVLVGVVALAGFALVAAAVTVLVEGLDDSARPVAGDSSTTPARLVAVRPAINSEDVGASVDNGTDADVALMGVAVWVGRQPVRVNATEMWLPVLAGDRSQVGAASDAGGFVIPSGVVDGARAEIAFRFDDSTCVITDVTAAARAREHRSTYPKSNRTIGPVTDEDPPARSAACGGASAGG
jgi:hypothetical protein